MCGETPVVSEVSEMATFMPNSNSKWPFFIILKCGLNFSRSSWQWLIGYALMSSWTGVSNYRFLDFFFRAALVYVILDRKVSQQHSKRGRGLNYPVCTLFFPHLYIWALNDNKSLGSSYLDFIQHLCDLIIIQNTVSSGGIRFLVHYVECHWKMFLCKHLENAESFISKEREEPYRCHTEKCIIVSDLFCLRFRCPTWPVSIRMPFRELADCQQAERRCWPAEETPSACSLRTMWSFICSGLSATCTLFSPFTTFLG